MPSRMCFTMVHSGSSKGALMEEKHGKPYTKISTLRENTSTQNLEIATSWECIPSHRALERYYASILIKSYKAGNKPLTPSQRVWPSVCNINDDAMHSVLKANFKNILKVTTFQRMRTGNGNVGTTRRKSMFWKQLRGECSC